MARRRTRVEGVRVDVMPREFLEPDARAERCRWYVDHGLWSWADQHAALTLSREAYGIEVPDARAFFRRLPTKSAAPIPPRRRNAARRRGPSPNSEETTP